MVFTRGFQGIFRDCDGWLLQSRCAGKAAQLQLFQRPAATKTLPAARSAGEIFNGMPGPPRPQGLSIPAHRQVVRVKDAGLAAVAATGAEIGLGGRHRARVEVRHGGGKHHWLQSSDTPNRGSSVPPITVY